MGEHIPQCEIHGPNAQEISNPLLAAWVSHLYQVPEAYPAILRATDHMGIIMSQTAIHLVVTVHVTFVPDEGEMELEHQGARESHLLVEHLPSFLVQQPESLIQGRHQHTLAIHRETDTGDWTFSTMHIVFT